MKYKELLNIGATFLLLFVSVWGSSCGAESTQVMLIGTFHFSNPGKDLNNVQADDVLKPKRQEELAQITASLSRFKPTKVAVEWPAELTDRRYEQFVQRVLPESHNEVVQLGFRLAKANDLRRVYGVDVEGDFPFEDVAAWAKNNGRQNDIDRAIALGAAETRKLSTMQEGNSIGSVLYYMNQPVAIAANQSFYAPMLKMGRGDEQPGAKLIAAWHARNLQICARLIQLTAPGDHVVVIFGQGHMYLLRQCLAEQPAFELVDPLPYLKAS